MGITTMQAKELQTLTLKEVAEHLKKNVVGPAAIVRFLHRVRQTPGSVRIVNYACVLNSTELMFGADVPGATGAAGLDEYSAMVAALGEAVERYCAACIPWSSLVYGSQKSIGDQAIGLDKFELYLPEQYTEDFPCRPYSADSQLYWAHGRNLLNNEPFLIPAPQVYIPYIIRDTEHQTDFVSIGVSSGAAAHSDILLARLNGLYEAIERDAFIITWMRKMTRTRINWQNDIALKAMFDKHYGDTGVIFHCFDLTLDIKIPTVLCLAESELSPGKVCVAGCATRATYREACEKAMLEASQCVTWAHHLLEGYPDWTPGENFCNVTTFQDHVLCYLQTGMYQHLNFLLETPYCMELPETPNLTVQDKYQHALSEVGQAGLKPIEVDLTTAEVDKLGLKVVKIVVPGLAQINGNHRFPTLADQRFDTVPEKLGLVKDCAEIRNPMPHPFP